MADHQTPCTLDCTPRTRQRRPLPLLRLFRLMANEPGASTQAIKSRASRGRARCGCAKFSSILSPAHLLDPMSKERQSVCCSAGRLKPASGAAFASLETLVGRTFSHLHDSAMVDSLSALLLFLGSPFGRRYEAIPPPEMRRANSGAGASPEGGVLSVTFSASSITK